MDTIFDQSARDKLIRRINALHENSTAQWGRMNVWQMVKHCTLFEEMIHGKRPCKRSLIGRVFGKMALKGFMKEQLLKRNMPSSPELIVKEPLNGAALAGKKEWIALIETYEQFSNHNFIHPFFGPMTKEQIGVLAYKHTDHHLRQFNV